MIDKSKAKSQTIREAFLADMRQLQYKFIPWTVDVNTHAATLQEQVRDIATKHFA